MPHYREGPPGRQGWFYYMTGIRQVYGRYMAATKDAILFAGNPGRIFKDPPAIDLRKFSHPPPGFTTADGVVHCSY
ncbi:MAG: hypothetical protein ABI760_22325 [Ferruginibacter sp.]